LTEAKGNIFLQETSNLIGQSNNLLASMTC